MKGLTSPLGNQMLPVWIRWMIRRDMMEVLEIETSCFEFPWTEQDFIRCLRQRNCIGMIAEFDDRVVGFMVYELHKEQIHILNFAVHPDFQRLGIASQLVNRLLSKLSFQRRKRLMLEVRETNLAMQLFLRARGFKAINVMRDYYDDTTEDAYLMQRNVASPTFARLNRDKHCALVDHVSWLAYHSGESQPKRDLIVPSKVWKAGNLQCTSWQVQDEIMAFALHPKDPKNNMEVACQQRPDWGNTLSSDLSEFVIHGQAM